jgi:hypothetical protein
VIALIFLICFAVNVAVLSFGFNASLKDAFGPSLGGALVGAGVYALWHSGAGVL